MKKHDKLDINSIFDDPDFDKERADANSELICIIAQYLTDNPTLRFGQALRNLNVIRNDNFSCPPTWVNEFNTEPTEMVKRAKKALKEGV